MMQVLEVGAILFDMDGTLVDSDQCVLQTWQAWCAEYGIELEEVLRISHGTPCRQTIAQLAPHLDLDLAVARHAALEIGFDEGQSAIPGAHAILKALPVERWALVTSATEPIARLRFQLCELPFPEVAITAELVRRGKPSPEPFLLGAERLGVAPRDCVVFEDSPAGVQAALTAGCQVVVLGDARIDQRGVRGRIRDYRGVHIDCADRIKISLPFEI